MIGKDLILITIIKSNCTGALIVLCTELGEIQTKLVIEFVNDEPVMKDL